MPSPVNTIYKGTIVTFEIFRSDGRYRWRLRNANGCVIANSDASYAHRDDAVRAVAKLKTLPGVIKLHAAVAAAAVVDVTTDD